MAWWLPLAGAAAGALMNRKNPLQGAAMGGLLGYGAGAMAPSLAGGSSSGLLSTPAANGAFLGEGVASGVGPWDTAMTKANLMGGLKTASSIAQPVGSSLMAANAAKGLLAGDQPMQPSPMMPQQITGPQTLNQIVAGNQQGEQANMDRLMQQRLARRKMWGMA